MGRGRKQRQVRKGGDPHHFGVICLLRQTPPQEHAAVGGQAVVRGQGCAGVWAEKGGALCLPPNLSC